MKHTHETPMSATQSVDLVANIVGSKLDITGEKTRCLAITGALSQVTRTFYSRHLVTSETNAAVNHGNNQTP
ncbi:porin [Dickeya lacustris]|uniref:Porin n=1 Tax=Dickeya lacustris TaxID=2259638 RepID=A0ABY8G7N9_9GAMM|nr:porin [Dickeya lacustris]WFN55983.1 porin [Dickeya lacustris]